MKFSLLLNLLKILPSTIGCLIGMVILWKIEIIDTKNILFIL